MKNDLDIDTLVKAYNDEKEFSKWGVRPSPLQVPPLSLSCLFASE